MAVKEVVPRSAEVRPPAKAGTKWHPRRTREGSRKPNALGSVSGTKPTFGKRPKREPDL